MMRVSQYSILLIYNAFPGIPDDKAIPMHLILAALLLLAWLPLSAAAQQAVRPSLSAIKLKTAPALDGEVLEDTVWQAVSPETRFTQTTPDEGRPISQRTELRVGYTRNALYVAFVCHDDDPAAIITTDTRRDGKLNDNDSVRFILDTYLDEQNGFVFGTNPAGMEYDGQLSKGDSGSSFGFAGGGFNLNWDGVWSVRTQIGDYGWSAEFRIPFKTIRYGAWEIHDWGINFQRNIQRRHEKAFWAPLERQYNITRLASAGTLTDLRIGKQRNLKVVPYVLGQTNDVGDEGMTTDSDLGFDVKYSITPALTLDLTYNTDFAQVEADELQISLDRFNLFFPEKRPFFLENAGLFTVGRSQQVELFFSRRIGLSDDGGIIPINGGARLSGALMGANVGLMYLQTDGLAGVASPMDFAVVRVNKELPNRSSLGALVADKAVASHAMPGETDNRTWGLDGRWGIGDYGLVSGYVAQTDTPGLEGDDTSWSLAGSWDSPDWSLGLSLVEVGENFNPEVGFINRSGGYENLSLRVLRRFRFDSSSNLLELRPHFSYTVYRDPDDFKESGFLHIDNHTEWKSGYEVHTGVNFVTKGLQDPFEIYDGIVIPAGSYHNSEAQLVGMTDDSKWISLVMRVTAGGFYSGNRVAISPTVQMRLGEQFVSELGWSQNDVDLPQGQFTTDVGLLRMAWSFTPRITLEALLQYNNVDDLLSTNLRFSWLQEANTGLYVVFNDIDGLDAYTGAQPDRSLIAKYTHMFDL